jgi:hypothetical protein
MPPKPIKKRAYKKRSKPDAPAYSFGTNEITIIPPFKDELDLLRDMLASFESMNEGGRQRAFCILFQSTVATATLRSKTKAMYTDEKQHPDQLQDWQRFKNTIRGSMEVADDAAIEAYQNALKSGKTEAEAGKIFFKTYNEFRRI